MNNPISFAFKIQRNYKDRGSIRFYLVKIAYKTKHKNPSAASFYETLPHLTHFR